MVDNKDELESLHPIANEEERDDGLILSQIIANRKDHSKPINSQIVLYEKRFLADERKRVNNEGRGDQTHATGNYNHPSPKEEKSIETNTSSPSKGGVEEFDRTPWNLNYIFDQWWNQYGIGNYSEVKGFSCKLPESSNNERSEGGGDNFTIGPIASIVDACCRDWRLMTKVYDERGEQIKITITGVGLYDIALWVKFHMDTDKQVAYFSIEDVIFNFDSIIQDNKKSWKRIDIDWSIDSPKKPIDFLHSEDLPINDSKIIDYKRTLLETRNAKAAIISRNLSHNIGSHVISYMRNDIMKDSRLDIDATYNNLAMRVEDSNNKDDIVTEIYDICDEDKKRFSRINAYISGIKHFLTYLQERQDYIALVAGNNPLSLSTVNFKDEVYDVLNPDKKHIRHHDSPSTDNLLLQSIARSEGFERPHVLDQEDRGKSRDIVIRFGEFSGQERHHEDLERMRRWNVAMPVGAMGRQAIFSIIENVIRNAAKHDAKSLGAHDNLELTLDYYDINSYTQLKDDVLRDNILAEYYVVNDKEDEYYYVTLTVNVIPSEEDLDRLRLAIANPFIKEHIILEENKGIKEMRIASAWLRAEEETVFCDPFTPEKIAPPSEKTSDADKVMYLRSLRKRPPILFVRKDSRGYLQYIFCLLKVKELAYVVSNTTKRIPEWPIEWGWRAFKEDDYCKLGRNTFLATVVSKGADFCKVASCSGYRVFKESELSKKPTDCETETHRNDFIVELLKRSSKYEEGDKIYIADDSELCADDAKPYIEIYKYDSDKTETKNHIRYLFLSHYNPLFNRAETIGFIEEITGNNSTDRLFRHYNVGNDGKSLLDRKWFYTHLLVAKSRVLIFDERLFERMVDENNMVIGLANADKNVWFYDIRFPDRTEDAVIMGMKISGTGNNRKIVKCEIIKIRYDAKRGEVITPEAALPKGDFVSIHQGLFDKMYDKWSVRDSDTKKNLVRSVYKMFCNTDKKRDEIFSKKDLNYCPGLIVHSGRSMPTRDSMPMNIPFLPYALIEGGVSDCKYTIVNLLVNAKCQKVYDKDTKNTSELENAKMSTINLSKE